jgi:hypothetical protein
MMFTIVVIFVLASGQHGDGSFKDKFPTKESCEAARPEAVESFRKFMEHEHGPVKIESRCEIIGEPV